MNRKLLLFAFAVFLAVGFTIDDNPLQDIIAKLKKFTETYPQEKIHLQLDKPYYAVGEDIWLKAYVVTAEKNEPSPLSKILYVELINPDNEVEKKITLAVDSSRAFGQLTIPDSLAAGNYRLRAYTNYMRNFDNDFFYERFITLGNLTDYKPTVAKNKKNNLSVQFFPEGGDLIYGLRSKVGVKVVNQDGIGINVSGYIIDHNKQKVALFNAEHAGMGSFALHPIKGETYSAVIENNDGTTGNFNLPKIAESGYALSVNSVTDNDNVTVRIAASADLVNDLPLSLVAQSNGNIYFTSTSKMDNAVLSAVIPKKRFPTGITQFTLFSGQNPVAERIIFVDHNDGLKINISNMPSTALQHQSGLNLMVTDVNNNPIDGNFSVAITDLGKVPVNEDDEQTILTNLLLTSDLKGFVEQPNYYFNNANPDKQRQLDNLLLTQGWRRFVWNDVLSGKEIALNNRLETSLEIAGQATDMNNKPAPGAKVVLMSTSNQFSLMLDTVADEKGRFTFDRLDVPDTVNFIIQAKSAKGEKNVRISIDQPAKANVRTYIGPSVNLEPYMANAKLQYTQAAGFVDEGIRLKQVTISKKKEMKPIMNIPNSRSRNGSADYVVKREQLQYTTGTILDLFQNIPGVKRKDGALYRTIANTVSMAQNFKGKPQPMLVILDGNPMRTQEPLSWMQASSVEGIEVLISNHNTVMYEDGYWGVVLITTKAGTMDDISKDPTFKTYNVAQVTNRGFSPLKEFYKPAVAGQPIKKLNPLRSTIYWNPNINTDANGKAKVLFENTAHANYRIVVEGMDAYGNIGRKTYTYQTQL